MAHRRAGSGWAVAAHRVGRRPGGRVPRLDGSHGHMRMHWCSRLLQRDDELAAPRWRTSAVFTPDMKVVMGGLPGGGVIQGRQAAVTRHRGVQDAAVGSFRLLAARARARRSDSSSTAATSRTTALGWQSLPHPRAARGEHLQRCRRPPAPRVRPQHGTPAGGLRPCAGAGRRHPLDDHGGVTLTAPARRRVLPLLAAAANVAAAARNL